MSLSRFLSKYITNFFVKNKVINNSEAHYYSYSFEFVLDLLLFCFFVIIIGAVTNTVVLSLLTLVCILPLRMIAGGAHASSKEMCNIISYLFVLACIWIAKHNHIFPIAAQDNHNIWIIIYILSAINIVFLSPVEHKNKRFDDFQKFRLKKYCFLYCSALCILYLFLYFFRQYPFCLLMNITSIVVLINQYIGILQLKLYRKRNLE